MADNNAQDENANKRGTYYTSLGLIIGLVFGLFIGQILFPDNFFMGIGIWMGLGLAIGAGVDASKKKKEQEN